MNRLKNVALSSIAIFSLVANGVYLKTYHPNVVTIGLAIISITSCCVALFYLWGGQESLAALNKEKENNIEKRVSKNHIVDKAKETKRKISA